MVTQEDARLELIRRLTGELEQTKAELQQAQAWGQRLEEACRMALRQKTSAVCICSSPFAGEAACRECVWSGALEVALADSED